MSLVSFVFVRLRFLRMASLLFVVAVAHTKKKCYILARNYTTEKMKCNFNISAITICIAFLTWKTLSSLFGGENIGLAHCPFTSIRDFGVQTKGSSWGACSSIPTAPLSYRSAFVEIFTAIYISLRRSLHGFNARLLANVPLRPAPPPYIRFAHTFATNAPLGRRFSKYPTLRRLLRCGVVALTECLLLPTFLMERLAVSYTRAPRTVFRFCCVLPFVRGTFCSLPLSSRGSLFGEHVN